MGIPIGLDHSAVLAVGSARGVDLELLASVITDAEFAILNGREGDGTHNEEE